MLVTTATFLFASCRDATSPLSSLQSARAKWAERGPSSYAVTVTRACECTLESSGPAVVTVRNGVIESRVYLESGAPVPAEIGHVFPDVTQLFAHIEAALREGAARVNVSYDAELGYPVDVYLDGSLQIADDEIFYRVIGLVAR